VNRSRKHRAELDARNHRAAAFWRFRQEGRTLQEYANEFGVSLRTANNDRDHFMEKADEAVVDLCTMSREELRHQIRMELEELKAEAATVTDPGKRIYLKLQIVERKCKLYGLDEPTRTQSTNVNVQVDASGRFHKFVQSAAGLSEAQLEQVFVFAEAMPREELPMPAGPPPLQLEAGESK